MILQKITESSTRYLKTLSLFLFFLIGGQHTLFSQNTPFKTLRILHYTSDNGLPQNTITDLRQDRLGNMWLATQGGLVIFNGQYFIKPHTATSSPRLIYIVKGKDGNLYFRDDHNIMYEADEQNFNLIPLNKHGIKGDSIFWHQYTGAADSDFQKHFYYYFSYNKIIEDSNHIQYLLNPDDGSFSCFDKSAIHLSTPGKKAKVFTISDKAIVFSENGSRNWYQNHRKHGTINAIHFSEPVNDINTFFKKTFIFSTEEGTFGIHGTSIYKIHLDASVLSISKWVSDIPPIKNIGKAIFDKQNMQFIIGSYTDGLYIIQPGGFFNKIHDIKPSTIFSSQTSNSVYLQLMLPGNAVLDSYWYLYKENEELAHRIKNIPPATLLDKDKSGHIWYQDIKAGEIHECDSSLHILHRYPLPITDKTIDNLCGNDNDTFYFNSATEIFRLLKSKPGLPPVPVASTNWAIQSTYPIDKEHYWILTNRGILVFDKKTNKLTKLQGAGDRYYRSISRSSKGLLLLGTYGNGPLLYRNGQFIPLPTDKNNYLSYCHCFIQDTKGFIWISTNNGIFQVRENDILDWANGNATSIYYHYYDKSYGFRNNEFNSGYRNATVSPDTTLISFSNMEGIVQFNPNQITPLLPVKSIQLYNLQIDDSIYSFVPSEITLQSDYKYFSLSVSTSYYGHPQNRNIEYRVAGYDDTWKPLNIDNTIRFGRISHGHFVLELRNAAGFGADNYMISKIQLFVKPFWYQRWWSLLLLLAGILGITVIVNRIKNRTIKRRQKNLETLIESKTSELKEKNKRLALSIRENEIVHSILLHDIKGPVKFINDISEGLAKNWLQFTEESRIHFSSEISTASKNIYEFISNFLSWVKYRKEDNLPMEPVLVKELIEEIFTTKVPEKHKAKNLLLEDRSDPNMKITSHKQVLRIILYNIFDNAMKYTHSGSIVFSTKEENDGTTAITCTDTGVGMTAQKIRHILSAEKNEITLIDEDSFQLGYMFIRELLPLIHGEITITSEPGKSTAVSILLPAGTNNIR